MIVFVVAVALGGALTVWVVAVVRRVKTTDREVRAMARSLADSHARREGHLATVRSAVTDVDRTFEQWNETLGDSTEELRALLSRVPSDFDPSERRWAVGDPRQTKLVKIVGGKVARGYAIRNLKMTLDGRGPLSEPTERDPRETLGLSWRHPVEFVVPTLGIPRPVHSSSRSAVAVEDMLASKGVAQALVRTWPEAEVHTRSIDPGSEWTEVLGNICTFCRDTRNPATGRILSHPAVAGRLGVSFQDLPSESDGAGPEVGIILRGAPPVRSPSYAQERDLKAQGDAAGRAILNDFALLARVSNPWDPEAKILVVAGIRAFGTLGAADLLRTRWEELYEATGDGDFACLVSVQAAYQVVLSDELSIATGEPDEVATCAVELVPAEDIPTEIAIVRVEPAA